MPRPVSTGMDWRTMYRGSTQIYLSLTNHPGQLSLGSSTWVGAMSTSQRAVTLCDWGVKADTVLFAGNTVWSIPECVRGVCAYTCCTNPRLLYCHTLRYIRPSSEKLCCNNVLLIQLPSKSLSKPDECMHHDPNCMLRKIWHNVIRLSITLLWSWVQKLPNVAVFDLSFCFNNRIYHTGKASSKRNCIDGGFPAVISE